MIGAHLRNQVSRVRIFKGNIFCNNNLSEHAAAGAQALGERARVDAGDAGDALVLQPLRQAALRGAMAVLGGELAHHQRARLDARRLEVARHAVVADQREGEGHDLAAVGRIGERLRVADHAGVEHHFARHRAPGAEAAAAEYRAVFEDELRVHFFSKIRLPSSTPISMCVNSVMW